MQGITVKELKKMEFFRQLSGGMIQTLLNEGIITSYPKKTVIFQGNVPREYVQFVLEGEVMLYNITKHGNRKILFILGQGSLLNHSIVGQKTLPLFCQSVGSVIMLQIPLRTFQPLMEHEPGLTRAVMQSYERYIWRLSHQLKNTTGNMRLERKIAAKLWKLGRDFGVEVDQGLHIRLDLTITLVADLVGAPRENVSRACKTLSDRGLLAYEKRHFILLDPDGLAEFYKQ